MLEDNDIPYQSNRKSPTDWYGFSLKDGLFVGIGDPSKLEFLIQAFKGLLDGKDDLLLSASLENRPV